MATHDDFNAALDLTLQFEGGYADDPADPGGETNFGISKRSYPDLDIANLTRADARAIYERDFWQAPHIDQLPGPLARKTFDLGVNMGARTAIKLLQRALNHANATPPLAIDGRIGPATIGAANKLDADYALMLLRSEARNHYNALASEHPSLRKYLRGWLRRAAA